MTILGTTPWRMSPAANPAKTVFAIVLKAIPAAVGSGSKWLGPVAMLAARRRGKVPSPPGLSGGRTPGDRAGLGLGRAGGKLGGGGRAGSVSIVHHRKRLLGLGHLDRGQHMREKEPDCIAASPAGGGRKPLQPSRKPWIS